MMDHIFTALFAVTPVAFLSHIEMCIILNMDRDSTILRSHAPFLTIRQ